MRWSDMDAYRHINNSAYLAYLEQARVAMFFYRHEGFSDGTVISRHEIDYLRPIVYHPEPLRLELWIEKVGGARFTVRYEVFDAIRPVRRAGGHHLRHVRLRDRPSAPDHPGGARHPRRVRRRRAVTRSTIDRALAEMAPLLRRVVALDPAALARVGTGERGSRCSYGCRSASSPRVPSRPRRRTARPHGGGGRPAGLAGRRARRGRRTARRRWRGAAPPSTGWQRVDTVPDDVIRGPGPQRRARAEGRRRARGRPRRPAAGRGRRRAARRGGAHRRRRGRPARSGCGR